MQTSDSYSSLERRLLGPGRDLLRRLSWPAVRLLARLGVSPNAVSLLAPALGVVFVFAVRRHPQLSFWIWLSSILVDGVDGALARYGGRVSDFGALLDQVADHTRETLIVVGLTLAGALNPLWGSLYPFVYTALNVTLFLGNRYRAAMPVAVKSYLVLYPVIALYLLSGRNWLDEGAALSIAFMTFAIVRGLLLLSRAMDSHS